MSVYELLKSKICGPYST